MTSKDLLLPVELAQALHDYLITRPFGEVERMVGALRTLKPAHPPEVAAPNNQE